MVRIKQTAEYVAWFSGLRDQEAVARIAIRIDRLALGIPGDAKSVGGKVSELRINYGPGYRVYFTRRGNVVVILLCGGDKGSQQRDIKTAQKIAANLKEDPSQ